MIRSAERSICDLIGWLYEGSHTQWYFLNGKQTLYGSKHCKNLLIRSDSGNVTKNQNYHRIGYLFDEQRKKRFTRYLFEEQQFLTSIVKLWLDTL